MISMENFGMDSFTAKREMADVVYKRGMIAFTKGQYQDTIRELSQCLSMGKADDYKYLEVDSYNTLGMLFSFTGYEATALDYYLSAYEAAKQQNNTSGMVSSLLNIGLLYQSCKEYARALPYYMQAKEVAEHDLHSNDMLLMLYADIQIAQLYCRIDQYVEARRISKEVENYAQVAAKGEFLLTKYILDILLAERIGDYDRVHLLVAEVVRHLRKDEQFVEQIDFYVDICEMMFSYGAVAETRIMLDLLREKIKDTDFLRLRMRLEQIEVNYQNEHGKKEEYKEACRRYVTLHEKYRQMLCDFQKKNLDNMDSMQKLEEEKREFERRSKCDLATGLLNKKAFCYDVEQCLQEHSGATMNAMIFLDIDNFKLVNDNFGHLFGDEVIVALAEKLQECFSEKCICGRFGGDEFTVFIKEVKDMMELEQQVEQFREEFAAKGFGKDEDIHITLSIGVSYNQGMRVSYQAMLSCADEALEKAKEYGKNRVSFYEIKRGIYNYV